MKVIEGIITSVAMQKTAVVSVERIVIHPLYKKRLKRSRNFKADTGEFKVNVGDLVRIEQTRPMSKDKHFKIVGITKEKKV